MLESGIQVYLIGAVKLVSSNSSSRGIFCFLGEMYAHPPRHCATLNVHPAAPRSRSLVSHSQLEEESDEDMGFGLDDDGPSPGAAGMTAISDSWKP